MKTSVKTDYDSQGFVVVQGLIPDEDRTALQKACRASALMLALVLASGLTGAQWASNFHLMEAIIRTRGVYSMLCVLI